MDQDQFGGRTDDDLFSDDIEPVEETVTLSTPAQVTTSDAPAQSEPPSAPAAQQPAPPPPKPARSSLAQSRHNPNAQQHKPARPAANNMNDVKPAKSEGRDTPSVTDPPSTTAPKPPPTGPREPSSTTRNNNNPSPATTSSSNTASAISAARLNSGANPRTKLTDAELAARMEKMRLLAAEKTRRFEEAQRDESEHAVAYAKGMEEARRRKAEEAARRRVAEEERKKLEEERAKNRERKLKALAGREKEGGWDLGRDAAELEGEDGRRGFRGAHGGVRGARGMGSSRFAGGGGVDEGGEYDGFGLRGRGGGFRGRGGRGRGRGGGRLFDEREGEYPRDQGRPSGPAPAPPPPKKADLKTEDFPALPSSTAAPRKIDTTWVPKPGAAEIPISPPVGKWDEEVAATLDANQTTS